ncbi:MAG: alpha/beta hydrolase [Blastocatellia bacterium]|nr:alpha/beta hydrolase [Blastocatellia bacterium]
MQRQIVFVAPEGTRELFRRLVAALEEEILPCYHDMKLLPPGRPLADWTLAGEVDALQASVEAGGLETFDLVGYSGGAAVSLAFAAANPARIRSLTLIEPPWSGNDLWGEEEREFVQEFDALVMLPPAALVTAFFELFAPGAAVPLPSEEERVARMAEALRMVWQGYRAAALARSRLAGISVPVYLPVGARSTTRMAAQAEMLASIFPRARVEIVAGRHHFDLLLREAATLAGGLSAIWGEDKDAL